MTKTRKWNEKKQKLIKRNKQAFILPNRDDGDSLINAPITDRTGLFCALDLMAMPRMPSRLRPFGGEHLSRQPSTQDGITVTGATIPK